jgi:hypothetical protein
MKTFFLFFQFSLTTLVLNAQGFLESKECNRNVNDLLTGGGAVTTPWLNSSTFKLIINGSCTGTLVNRYINNSGLGYYFLTAKHCISENEEKQLIEFMFNYQSPTGNSMDTPPSNRGNRDLDLNLENIPLGYKGIRVKWTFETNGIEVKNNYTILLNNNYSLFIALTASENVLFSTLNQRAENLFSELQFAMP